LGRVGGGSVHLFDLKEETPHCVRVGKYWEGEKDPFPTNPERQKINFGRSWRREKRRPLRMAFRGDMG